MRRILNLMVVVLLVLSMMGCANYYVDSSVKEIPAADYKKPVTPMPVQLTFEFQSKGVANAAVTKMLMAQVTEEVKGSGLFSEVKDTPVPNGAQLYLVLNNVPLADSASKTRAFVTGMTFGLAGSQAGDGYICTLKYIPNSGTTPITETARHAIYTTLGAKGAPANGIRMDNMDMAARTMTKQVVSHVLNALSHDKGFQ